MPGKTDDLILGVARMFGPPRPRLDASRRYIKNGLSAALLTADTNMRAQAAEDVPVASFRELASRIALEPNEALTVSIFGLRSDSRRRTSFEWPSPRRVGSAPVAPWLG